MNRLLRGCLAPLLIAGCAMGPARETKDMDALLGKADQAYFIGKYGPPDRKTPVGDGVELWEYRLSYRNKASAIAERTMSFDRLRLTFTRGVLSSWTGAGMLD